MKRASSGRTIGGRQAPVPLVIEYEYRQNTRGISGLTAIGSLIRNSEGDALPMPVSPASKGAHGRQVDRSAAADFGEAVRRVVQDDPRDAPADLAGLVAANRKYRSQRWPEPFNETTHQLVQGDSRNLDGIGDNTIHLIVTSPPYWTLKDYPEGNAQLRDRRLRGVPHGPRPRVAQCEAYLSLAGGLLRRR